MLSIVLWQTTKLVTLVTAMFKAIKTWFKEVTMTQEERNYRYLSESESLVDLEYRQRELRSRGYNA